MKVKFIIGMRLPNLLWLKRLPLFLFLVLLFLFARPSPTSAECFVQNTCDSGGTSTTFELSASESRSCPNEAEPRSYNLCCYDDEEGGRVYTEYGARYSAREHANSFYSLKSAVCGSAIETIPSCASCGGQLNCYGYENLVDKSTTDQTFANQSNGPIGTNGSFQYNGTTYNGSSVYFCNENLFACGTSGCSENFDFEQPNFVGETGGEGESRLWFPHIRMIAALSSMAQSLFNPYRLVYNSEAPAQTYTDSAFSKNAPPSDPSGRIDNMGTLTTRIEEHQGKNDTTRVVNITDNNSSLIVGESAPRPTEIPFDYTGTNIYNETAACVIPNANKTQGDDLLGPKITAEFLYTQKYEYEACPKRDGCTPDDAYDTANEGRNCCSNGIGSGRCHADPIREESFNPATGTVTVRYKCGTLPAVLLPAKGKVSTVTKNPLIEFIYKNIVSGEDSLLGRFMPSLVKELGFEDIPAEARYAVETRGYNQEGNLVDFTLADGGSLEPTIYTPHLGSIDKYWLKDFQDAIRPFGVNNLSYSTSSTTNTTRGQCTTMGFNAPFRDVSVDPKDVDTLVSDMRTINPGGFSQSVLDRAEQNLRARYTEVVIRSRQAGYNPAFVIAIWLEETAAGAVGSLEWGCGGSGGFENQLNCFLGLYDFYSANSPENDLFSCREGGDNPNFEDFLLFYSTGVCSTVAAQNRQFCGIHVDFPDRVQSFYELVAQP